MRYAIILAAVTAFTIAPAAASAAAGAANNASSTTGIGKGSAGDTTGIGKGGASSTTGIGKGSGSNIAPPPPPPPPVSGAMIVHHHVRDYADWRKAFDDDRSNQEAAGLTNPRVFAEYGAHDVWIIFDMSDEAKAKAFAHSRELRRTMWRAGVRGNVQIHYLTQEQ